MTEQPITNTATNLTTPILDKPVPRRKPLSGIPIDPKFVCPACGVHEERVVLFCSRCWWLVNPVDRAALRQMTIDGRDSKSKMAKCVRIVREKLGLPLLTPVE